MSNSMCFKNIRPYIRFSATQLLNLTAPYLKDADVIAYDHRLYYCTKGEGILFIDNEKYKVKPQTLIIWHSGLRYRCTNASENFTCITANFDFFTKPNSPETPITPQGIKYFDFNKIIEKDVFFEDNELFNDVIFIENIPEVELLTKEIVRTYRDGFNFNQLFLSSLLSIIFKLCIEHNQKKSVSRKQNLHYVVQYIHNHYKEDITNINIAEKFNYHPNYLSRLIYEHTGSTLYNYIIKYRLSRAVKLLMSTDLSISKICEEVNIPDQHYFSRLFKKYYKKAPSKFRQKV